MTVPVGDHASARRPHRPLAEDAYVLGERIAAGLEAIARELELTRADLQQRRTERSEHCADTGKLRAELESPQKP